MHVPDLHQAPTSRKAAPHETTMPAVQRAHDADGEHFHDYTDEEKQALADFIWRTDNIELVTVGIDIGSSTSHLMFAKVHLQRKSQMLSSGYVVVNRTVLWKSPILLTPFLPDNSIDATRLKQFIDEAYQAAGLARDAIDSGAVILTGEAIKRSNAEAIAHLFAEESGKFVCATAGHHLECMLAAHGSGAAALSRTSHRTVLNVDIGGGTTKFALIRNGKVAATCAVAIGGRLIVQDADGRILRFDESARHAARSLGLDLGLDGRISPQAMSEMVDTLAGILVSMIRGEPLSALGRELILTDEIDLSERPHLITFSGGVSEYVYGRETETFGDIAKPLADRIAAAIEAGRIDARVADPGNGIRATVIGASQFTVQVSGKTIHVSRRAELPVHNVPVVFPQVDFSKEFTAAEVTDALRAARKRLDLDDERTVAVAIRWRGDPHYAALRKLAQGIAVAIDGTGPSPLIVMVDGDVGRTLGNILEYELQVIRPVISIDGVQLEELDFVDIGAMVESAMVVPVVIKSLLFTPAG
ncbi:MAG: Reactivating factor for ethanolamine ammonia lyase [Noviherbaspirillum sp.]|nr:Reactivating factor for ethanolamine ammonia lyase [Noviherbaspirillum sp.]